MQVPFFMNLWAPQRKQSSNNDSVEFVLAAWHELFYGFTPDSFQPRLSNVPSLVEEIRELSLRWQTQTLFAKQVEKVKDELRQAIKSETKILALIPTYRSALVRLTSANTPKGTFVAASLLAENRNQYVRAFKDWSTKAIQNLPKGKLEAIEAIRRLATFAFQQGKEDDDVSDLRLDVNKLSPTELFERLWQLSDESQANFQCTLSVLGDINGMHGLARRQGLTLVRRDSLSADYLSTIVAANERTLHIQFNVPAKSIREAVAKARREIGIALGVVSLYLNPSELRLHSSALVSSEGNARVFVQTEQAFRRLHPRTRADNDISNAMQMISTRNVDNRVLGAIEQLALALSSSDTRTRLVSLWSSLETLAGAHEGETTLERIVDLIVPLITSRKIHKTTRYLAILCQEFGKTIDDVDYGTGFKKRSGKIELAEMLLTLTSPCNDRKIVELLKFAQHPLLRHHLYTTWKRFHDPKHLLDDLNASKLRLEWQLARIYRARNQLVHEGKEVTHIVPLLDNLQNYVSTLVQRLVHELKNHEGWDVRHAMEYWKNRMQHVFDCLKDHPPSLKLNDFLEIPNEDQIWRST